METFKQFKNSLENKIKSAIDQGDVFRANEIQANIFLGIVLTLMIIMCGLCLLLNEVGIFTAEKTIMRGTMAFCIAIQLPIVILNKKYHGEAKWLKSLLEVGIILVCALLSSTLGHNVAFVPLIPIILSLRYNDVYFTKVVAFLSAFVFVLAALGNTYFGILNLNMYKLAPGTVLTVKDTLRQAVLDTGVDRVTYFNSLMLNDYLPKFLVFIVIAYSCVKIADCGRSMITLQDEVSKKSSRLETELNLATEIQTGMLPCIFPAFPEHGELELYATNIPAKEVGGDFYDYFKIDDHRVAFVMADVSGKGVGAALFMTISKIVIKNLLTTLKSPAAALTEANRQLHENNEAMLFVTTWVGIYDINTGILTYSSAGHNPPIVYRKDGTCEYLRGINGLFLAFMDNIVYSENQISLSKGDEIFLYTDGVTEATRHDNELYGEERFIECFKQHNSDSVKEQVEAILDDVNKFVDGAEQFDDITMMGMKIV